MAVLLGELAELNLGHAADRGLFDEIHILLAQLALLCGVALGSGCLVLGKGRRAQQKRDRQSG